MHRVSPHKRRIDEMGRVIIPSDLRRQSGMDIGDYVDFRLCSDGLLLRRQSDSCIFCGSREAGSVFMDRPVCKACLDALRRQP